MPKPKKADCTPEEWRAHLDRSNYRRKLKAAGLVTGPTLIPWTGAEIIRARKLWKDGHTIRSIADQIGRSFDSVRKRVMNDRDSFPRRHLTRGEIARVGYIAQTVMLSPMAHARIKKAAKERNVPMSTVIREMLSRSP